MKKIGRNGIYYLLFLILFVVKLNAKVIVQAEVSDSKVELGQSFELDVSVVSTENESVESPVPPEMGDFQIRGTSQRTQISTHMQPSANGSGMEHFQQRTMQFSYDVIPTKIGKFKIDSFSVQVNGKVYKTAPIDIEVVKIGSPQSRRGNSPQRYTPQRNRNPSPFDQEDDPFSQMDRMEEELFNQLLKRKGIQNPFQNPNEDPQYDENVNPGLQKEPQFRSLPKNQDEAFFIQVEVDKTEVYEGEQILVSWYLLTRGQLESLDRTKFPDLKGFWKEIIEEVPSIQFYQEVINGVPYKKALLARHALFPLKAGETFIDEFKIKSKVRLPQQGFGFGFGRAYEYTKSSQRVKIKVKPLPTEGRPANFTGAVGQFQIKSNIEGSEPKAHQPLKLKLRIEGQGNAKGLELPPITWPEGLELFEVKNETKFLKSGQSFKEFEIILIPRKEGSIVIPSVEASFFNPETGKYYTAKSQEIPLQILPGDKTDSDQLTLRMQKTKGNEESVKLAPPEIIPSMEGFQRGAKQILSPIWLSLFSAILIFLIYFSYQQFEWNGRKRNIRKEILSRFQKIENKFSAKKSKDTAIEITNLFYFLLGYLSGEGGGSEEFSKLVDKIPSSIRRQYQSQLVESFDYFQTLSFAPDEIIQKMGSGDEIKRHVEKTKKLFLNCLNEHGSERTT